MIANIIDSFLETLTIIGVSFCVYLILSIVFDLIKFHIVTNNHALKKQIKAQNNVIASLCNALRR